MEIRDSFVVAMFSLLKKCKIDGDKITLAALLILIGVLGRILLIQYANIETVLAICLLSGVLLGGIYCITIPLAVMLISDWWIYTYTNYALSFGFNAILGLTFFTWSGFLVVGVIGFSMKKRFVYNMGGVAVLSGVGVLATIFYDAWTAFGFWYFIASPHLSIIEVYFAQIPFTMYHLLSSLIFVPLFTILFIYLHKHTIPYIKGVINPVKSAN